MKVFCYHKWQRILELPLSPFKEPTYLYRFNKCGKEIERNYFWLTFR